MFWKKLFPLGLHSIVSRFKSRSLMFGLICTDAGLTTEERDLIATAYDRGIIKGPYS